MHVKKADAVQSGYVQIHGEIDWAWHFSGRQLNQLIKGSHD